MPDTTTTPLMQMILPVPGVRLGRQWALDLIDALTIHLDPHDHSSGKGAKVGPAGLDIIADLSFLGSDGNNHNLTDLRSARLVALGAAIGADPADRHALFAVGNELYYIDGAGNAVRLTLNGAIDAATAGGISGMAGGAAVAYSAISKFFTFIQAANQAAGIDVGNVNVREMVVAGNAVTMKVPAGLAASYNWIFPAALPASWQVLQIDAAGQVTAANPAGMRIGHARTDDGSNVTNNTHICPIDNTIPVIAGSPELDPINTAAATYAPKKSNSKIRVRAGIYIRGNANATHLVVAIGSSATGAVVKAVFIRNDGSAVGDNLKFVEVEYEYAPGSVAAVTWTPYIGGAGAGGVFTSDPGSYFGGTFKNYVEVEEIAQ